MSDLLRYRLQQVLDRLDGEDIEMQREDLVGWLRAIAEEFDGEVVYYPYPEGEEDPANLAARVHRAATEGVDMDAVTVHRSVDSVNDG